MLPLFIAWRYLKGLRRGNAAPLLAGISIAALAVGTAAMIVLFSVFNGFNGLITELYKSFYPDVRISATKGKFFTPDAHLLGVLQAGHGIAAATKVLEDNVWATNAGEQQVVATVKGVENAWFKVNNLEPYLAPESAFDFTSPDAPEVIMGAILASQLGTPPGNPFSHVVLNYPNTGSTLNVMDMEHAFRSEMLSPTGIFSVQQEFDERYLLAPLAVVQRLVGQGAVVSAIELKVTEEANVAEVAKSLQRSIGAGYRVQTRYEQNRTLFAIMSSEKFAIYAILLFVLLLASVNIIGALSLLALEKEQDAAILKAMGALPKTIRLTFLAEGALWGLAGGAVGLLLGGLICAGQHAFGWVKLHGFIVEEYPVVLKPLDFAIVLATAAGVGLLAAVYPAKKLARKNLSGGWNAR